ncbi:MULTISPECIES: ThuA domain-containing protein [Micromonospora]|uniref:Glucose/arabinose dehydrogenase, beta-propeller fold n=1 Tax=Micromonospora yangpuensis TaxID=683228 RepID=A0A1C6UM50_9ACTN|nr:ThuA domain-containing protein [Micromonospora yangpuensis]GGM27622.1 glycosyl hydrolase [Micromonospora yangpuensis]SCL55116.1 Glucose/arabinose dehydrogenase, beta-propeller fold [Micromonospora yangpuensis]
MRRNTLITGVITGLVLAFALVNPATAAPAFRALLFTKTVGYRHDSIPAGISMFQQQAAANNFELVHSEDSSVFTPANLATFDVLIMFQTSGMVWTSAAQRQAVEGYLASGKGIVAVHNATDMGIEGEYPWWDQTVNAGAHMTEHSPGVLPGTAIVADRKHPSTAGLPDRWNRSEEWYNFDRNPRGDVHVLVTADERTYNPGARAMGPDHPISWCRNVSGGRVWSTGMGHAIESYSETHFRNHILGGVKWAAGNEPGDCGGTVWGNFEKRALDDNTVDPMALAVAPDGRVLYVQRGGQVKIFKPGTNSTVTAGTLSVYTGGEDGLTGLALDPNFATNGYVYLYHSPAGSATDVNRVSRYTLTGDTLNTSSGVTVIDIPATRDRTFPEPGHTGGYIEFGPDGNLYIGTGDDVPPNLDPNWQGYAPLDWRSGKANLDAARTAGNTNDLRGKLLRIRPQASGGYTIPAGNLYPQGTAQTRPEIYAMGFRNPFRFSIDPANGWVYLADYGPDRNPPTTNRGPEGLVELNVIKAPGNYGWPFCHGDNQPYAPYNPDTGVVGAKFNCSAPVNNSPNNTGLTSLRPVVAPNLWYGYGTSPNFPELGSGGSGPMGGPVYRYDPANPSPTKFPPYYDGVHFFYEWSRSYLKEVHFDSATAVTRTNSFLPNGRFNKPMDLEFGRDGSLYLLEWGTNFGGGNSDSGLYRIDYVQGGRSPVAKATGTPTSGNAPLTVQFSSAGTADPDPGNTLSYQWTFGDGTTSTAANPSHVYTANGNYTAQLKVTDNTGKTGFANVTITVGNTAPVVTITTPANGGMLTFGDRVSYQISVTDPDGGTVDCAKVILNPALGHDDHAHETTEYPGCSGTISTDLLGGHPDGANLFYVLNARYTDNGGAGGAAPLTGYAQVILQPKHKQAEYYSSQSGTRVIDQAAAESGKRVGDISNNDWVAFTPMSLSGISTVSYRLSSPSGGGTIELRAGSPTGTLLATTPVPSTGGWNNYQSTPPVNVTALAGTHQLYLVFKGSANNWFDLDSHTFGGSGVGTPGPTGVAGRTWTLTAQHSGKVMDVSGVSTADGAQINQWAATGGNNQKWQAVDAGGGAVYLKAVHSGKCAEVTGGSTAAGAFLQQAACTNGNQQKFTATATGTSGVYTVRSVPSGLCLDVNGGATTDGARLVQWTCHGGTNQQWRFGAA